MDPVRNPYSPGAGRAPAALVGRDEQSRAWEVALDRLEAGRTAQPMVLYGLRGVGKTVLLTDFYGQAVEQGWVATIIEAGAGKPLRATLGESLHEPLTRLARPDAGHLLRRALKTALSFKVSYDTAGSWTFGLDLDDIGGGGADTGLIETDLMRLLGDLAQAAREDATGVAVLVDEAQDLTRDELVAICAVAHRAGQLGWPLLIALAGLPDLPRRLTEAKSYAERLFAYTSIERLPHELAMDALTAPAAVEGVTWERAAADYVVRETEGYPYFLQQFGQETWNYSHSPDTISLLDAEVGAARGVRALDHGFFRSRWERATPSEQRYLRAMAEDGDLGSQSGDVAARLNLAVTSLGPTRANLIAKGLIYAPEHGRVRFTVPSMAAFIRRQPT